MYPRGVPKNFSGGIWLISDHSDAEISSYHIADMVGPHVQLPSSKVANYGVLQREIIVLLFRKDKQCIMHKIPQVQS